MSLSVVSELADGRQSLCHAADAGLPAASRVGRGVAGGPYGRRAGPSAARLWPPRLAAPAAARPGRHILVRDAIIILPDSTGQPGMSLDTGQVTQWTRQ